MMRLMKLAIVVLITTNCFGQTKNQFFIEENKNQFPETVKYKADLPGSRLFFEKNKFTFVIHSVDDLKRIHDAKHLEESGHQKGQSKSIDETIRLHSFQATFVNSNPNVVLNSENKSSFYSNYFIGNNSQKWSSEVYSYEKIIYKNLYPNIDLVAYSKDNQFKYDFIIQAGSNPNQIQINYTGAEQLLINNNTLIIKTSIGDVVESIPLAYQMINGKQISVACNYLLNDTKISFQFPSGYNQNYPLIIDPVLVAATYAGGTAMTFGHSATYDNSANIYTGGECFGAGYPATLGAFDVSFAGSTDIAISKLNPNGSNLIWATYLGGTGGEIPNSLFVNNSGEIYIMGASNSINYPVTAGCFDNTQNGVEDIVVSHLNATGTALVGSTYIGGTGSEGRGGIYWMNGHDGMRGEIIVDASDNAWIANYTSSTDFPTTVGAYDQTYNGGAWDACVLKLSSNMSSLLWSTFLGGVSDDVGYGLRLNSVGEAYVTGVTSDNTFPSTAGVYQSTFQGGASDGFITKFNASGSGLVASTFIGGTGGTSDYDASYFIDLDGSGDPYIFGTSQGAMPVTGGVYSNAGSGNFISKLNANLTALAYSTVVGGGAASFIEPEAFMVDTCENVYIAGFGAFGSYPVTPTALYTSTTALGNCYLMTLSKDAMSLLYGSFYHGNHVDGGTSRFDPSGTIYLGICMGSTVPVPAWAWDTSAPSWDMFVVKIEFQLAGVNAVASVTPDDTVCLGTSVSFNNTSNGVTYIWDFGDGSPTSSVVSPTHFYTATGIYIVSLTAIDSASCNIIDSTFITITVLASPSASAGNDTTVCSGPVQLTASGGTTYLWTPSIGLSNPNIANPIANPTTTSTYIVEVSNGACSDFDTITIYSGAPVVVSSNQTICAGDSVGLTSSGGITYSWTPSAGLGSSSIANPVASPTTTTTYTVTATDANGCTGSASVTIVVNPIISSDFFITPAPPYYINTTITFNDYSTSANTWDFGDNTNSSLQSPDHMYTIPGIYTICHVIDVAGCVDTICKTVEVSPFNILVPNVITTNGDGQNEYLLFQYLEYYPGSRLEIYNRWGLKLYEDDNYQNNWDGSKYSDGVYYFILYLNKNGSITSIPGFFHLLREK